MTKKTPGQLLLEKLEAESAAIHKAMEASEAIHKAVEVAAESKVGQKISQKRDEVQVVAKELVAEVAEEITDDTHILLKKVKAFLPSRSTTFHVLKIVIYWELCEMIVKFIFIES